jgi:ribosomal protein S18 acetylase RimI-like enzyme
MDPLNRLFLAIDNDTQELLSTVFLRRFPESMVSSGITPESPVRFGIYGVWTLPIARRRGIARQLLEEVIRLTSNIARIGDRDCSLEVEVFKHNEGAVKLYRNAGFEEHEAEEGDMRKLTLLVTGPEEAVAEVA